MDPSILNYYDRLREGLALSDLTMNHAILIHEKVLNSKFEDGLEPFILASSCIYIASKYRNTPRNLKQVSAIGGITRKDIARCYRLLIRNSAKIGFIVPNSDNHYHDPDLKDWR